MDGNKLSAEGRANLQFCSALVGRYEEESFSQHIFSACWHRISSPIEQLFFISFSALMKIYSFHPCELFVVDGVPQPYGYRITPQFEIARYRADFYVEYFGYGHASTENKKVVVECDSQQWHERTEKERRYEKRRDRELARLGLHTFRFTGKEIMEDPFKPAAEVCGFVTNTNFCEYKDMIDSYKD